MKLKTFEHDGVTYGVLDDKGLPVYVHADGKEVGLDGAALTTKITALNGEAMQHRTAKEAAEAALAAFQGIDDPAAALAALETVKNISTGDLTTAAKVQEIKDAAKRAAEEQVAAAVRAKDEELAKIIGERDGIKSALDNELIGGGFARSSFISEKIAIPADMMQAQFGRAFKVEDGQLVAYDNKGNKIFSRARPGEIANLDEALEELVGAYPNRDHILKGGVGAGGGAGGGGPKGTPGSTITRTEFLAKSPTEQQAISREGKLQVIDG